jgi:hypothetical protein
MSFDVGQLGGPVETPRPAVSVQPPSTMVPPISINVLAMGPTVVPKAGRSRVVPVLLGLTVVSAGYLAMLAFTPGGAELTTKLSDVVTTLAALAATISCAVTARRHGGALQAFWWLLAATCLAWTIGEATWSWYEVVLRVEVPYPSLADVGYLAGTPLAVAAFACHPGTQNRRRQQRLVPLLDAIAAAMSLLFVSWLLVLNPLWKSSGGRSLGDLVSLAYPFGDLIVLVLVVLALRNLPRKNRPATLLLFAGLLVMALTDSTYTYLAQIGQYHSGDLLDTGWVLAYLAIAAAGRVYEPPVDSGEREHPSSGVAAVLAPNVPILVALATIAVVLSGGGHPDRGEWLLATGLTLLVVTRQGLVLVQRRRPRPVGHQRRIGDVPGGYGSRRPAPVRHGDNRAEMQALTLQMLTAAQATPQERTSRVTGSLVMVLTSAAALLAVWDLFLLVRTVGGGAS